MIIALSSYHIIIGKWLTRGMDFSHCFSLGFGKTIFTALSTSSFLNFDLSRKNIFFSRALLQNPLP